jgi:hypothetical protein
MSLQDQLEALNTAFYEADGENRDEIVAHIKALHTAALKQPEHLPAFKELAPTVAGGAYIPYLIWMELAAIVDGRGDRDYWMKLIKALADSDFEPETLRQVRPLLVIYYRKERDFERAKMETHIVNSAHPQVREFFAKVRGFSEQNPTTAKAYLDKFMLLKPFFPNFTLFELPVQELEAQLGKARG